MNEDIDIYFHKEYCELYENVEKGKVVEYKLKTDNGQIKNIFIKREIPIKIDNNIYYDLTTAYGYGGPVILSKACDSKKMMNEYKEDFGNFCKRENIVSEFIRFHPLKKNYEYAADICEVQFLRNTIAIDLSINDILYDAISSKRRNIIKNALNGGIEIKFDYTGNTIEDFHKIYCKTMDKNNASDYYYFSVEFFKEAFSKLKDNVFIINAIYNSQIISSAMFLHGKEFMHYHFSATDPDFYKMNGNSLILYKAAMWGKENGKKLLHLGGGYSNSEDDNLLSFKASFSKAEKTNYYIGKNIYNKEIYIKLCKQKGIDANDDFFPAYRKI